MRHFTLRRPWAPICDTEWEALVPYVARTVDTAGRPLRDPRARFGAMFRNTLPDRPWRGLSEWRGKPDTLSRLFRRWTRADLLLRFLDALSAPDAPPRSAPWKKWLGRLARRGMRTLRSPGQGMAELAHVNRLGLLSSLPMVPWFLPNPHLSETVFRHIDWALSRLPAERPPPGLPFRLGRVLAIAGGRRARSRRFAPP